jgi:hypothetical protein
MKMNIFDHMYRKSLSLSFFLSFSFSMANCSIISPTLLLLSPFGRCCHRLGVVVTVLTLLSPFGRCCCVERECVCKCVFVRVCMCASMCVCGSKSCLDVVVVVVVVWTVFKFI